MLTFATTKCKNDSINSTSNLFYFKTGRVPTNLVINQDYVLLMKINFI